VLHNVVFILSPNTGGGVLFDSEEECYDIIITYVTNKLKNI